MKGKAKKGILTNDYINKASLLFFMKNKLNNQRVFINGVYFVANKLHRTLCNLYSFEFHIFPRTRFWFKLIFLRGKNHASLKNYLN